MGFSVFSQLIGLSQLGLLGLFAGITDKSGQPAKLSSYELLRIIWAVCIQRRTLIQAQAGFIAIEFSYVLFQLLGKQPYLNGHGTGPFAVTAIRAATS
jgi:uncharacterized oligopeptide transporter (OPT) family protein